MKLGFIGCGNMAKAIISGVISSKIVAKEDVMASDSFEFARKTATEKLGIYTTECNKEIAKECDVIFVAVKPHFYEEVLVEIAPIIKKDAIIITIAPGKTLEWIGSFFAEKTKIVRTMPNTPAMVMEGMTAVCPNQNVTESEMDFVLSLLNSFGKADIVSERMMDAVVAVSGSSPAYIYMFIEALADGAVMEGMPRDLAYKFASQAVIGSAKMVLETGMHPAVLKDMVCSPGGTTIQAVRVLEEKGFRGSVIEAMKVCAEKSKGM